MGPLQTLKAAWLFVLCSALFLNALIFRTDRVAIPGVGVVKMGNDPRSLAALLLKLGPQTYMAACFWFGLPYLAASGLHHGYQTGDTAELVCWSVIVACLGALSILQRRRGEA